MSQDIIDKLVQEGRRVGKVPWCHDVAITTDVTNVLHNVYGITMVETMQETTERRIMERVEFKKYDLEQTIGWISQRVEALNGCKATELAAQIDEHISAEVFPEALEEAVNRCLVVEVSYQLPDVQYEKLFLLPKGSRLLGSFGELDSLGGDISSK